MYSFVFGNNFTNLIFYLYSYENIFGISQFTVSEKNILKFGGKKFRFPSAPAVWKETS